jgi:hypothetical protein
MPGIAGAGSVRCPPLARYTARPCLLTKTRGRRTAACALGRAGRVRRPVLVG